MRAHPKLLPCFFFKLISLYYSYMQGLIRFSFLSYVLRWAWLYLSLFCQLLFVIYSGLPFYNDIICTSSFNLNWKRMIWNHNFKNPMTNEFTVESSLSLCVCTHTQIKRYAFRYKNYYNKSTFCWTQLFFFPLCFKTMYLTMLSLESNINFYELILGLIMISAVHINQWHSFDIILTSIQTASFKTNTSLEE